MNPAALAAVASERRRHMLRLLWQTERSAGDLAAEFDVSWPAISQHLRVLKDAGLIRERRDGRHRIYTADPDTLGPLEAVLTAMWRADLDRLAELAESEEGNE
ncbi:MAG TPA: metalloregulator ArsR/SmtB family transcription factor [Acidimicrobiia bacterium]|nr:metalloregulator ArsR/SmtB family transcription factor [Acidimicrobiia bacterium]